jgi:tRNA A-37 threonylcarbamoyl transferase component Bud32
MNYFTKPDVSIDEYRMQSYVSELGIVNIPKIISYDQEKKLLTMEKIPNLNISDMYGEKSSDIDDCLFEKIREIIKKLALNKISYPDITGYNFIEYNNQVWIIDFEHAKLVSKITDKFILKFIDGLNEWNPEFK